MLAVTLPSFINTDNLQTIALVVLASFVLLAYVAYRVVKAVVFRAILLGVIALLAFFVWSQRASVQECVDDIRSGADCTCTFFGFEVEVPEEASRFCTQNT